MNDRFEIIFYSGIVASIERLRPYKYEVKEFSKDISRYIVEPNIEDVIQGVATRFELDTIISGLEKRHGEIMKMSVNGYVLFRKTKTNANQT